MMAIIGWGNKIGVNCVFWVEKRAGQKTWATNNYSIRYVLNSLGSTHGLGSCKRSKRNRPISSKPHSLNFPNMLHGFVSCLKNKINTWIGPTKWSGSIESSLQKMCREKHSPTTLYGTLVGQRNCTENRIYPKFFVHSLTLQNSPINIKNWMILSFNYIIWLWWSREC